MNNQDAYALLDEQGCFEYGAVTPAERIREAFGIEEIEYPAMKREIETQVLQELSAVGYIRDRLLNKGKYIKGVADSYRILIPSENASQVFSYMESADKKLKRAIKLNKNTPPEYKIPNQDEVRMILKREEAKAGK